MAGEFGKFIDTKRKGRGPGGTDILLKDIAAAMGVTATYLSDIVKGRRNPPEMETLKKIAIILQLSPEERAEMGRRGREKMQNEFDRQRVVEAYKERIALYGGTK